MREKAEWAADEKRAIENGIESGCVRVRRFIVAARVKDRQLVAHPIFVDGEFERGHLRVDLDALSGDAVQAVFAENLIKRVIDIEPADVSVARPAEVVRLHVMIGHRADGRRPRDETVLVVVPTVVVEVPEETEFAGVTFPNQILSEHVCDVDLLVAQLEFVEI